MSLLKLSLQERKKIVELENRLAVLKAKSNAIREEKHQISLVEEINNYMKIIVDNFSVSGVTEEFTKQLDEIYNVTSQLRETVASRNLKKERTTMLFGHIKTLKEWDY